MARPPHYLALGLPNQIVTTLPSVNLICLITAELDASFAAYLVTVYVSPTLRNPLRDQSM